jgi:hypothetical protein
MAEGDDVDPTLSDMLQTALGRAKPAATEPSPASIVVHGHNNILSWGGDVHIADFFASGPEQK